MKKDAYGTAEIPDKFYFKIGEVSHIAEVPPYVLRFWETEFKQIKPKRTDAGQRLYRRQDVALILRIKRLLYDRKFTIEGARQHLKKKSGASTEPVAKRPGIAEIRTELKHIRDLLDSRRR
ncbi:MerR family transcriptional regulator [Desulfosarcina alkanivorans]|jgi:DNA-binding transcriptional MerR regulator|uniref:MerR family transcriptional regulator n=1 Tax=Desulfosarcina alkanivorans TaxID=571177 RepID=A0A5K7YJX4_9BACT|nr:MerR family transcriptional regulator [Desulfosarcina alkanivorans]BBO69158.1 MerR family transcriptional regulator [Desulfosarcina alkanivorans]